MLVKYFIYRLCFYNISNKYFYATTHSQGCEILRMQSTTVVEPMELPPELQKPLVPVPEAEHKKKLKVLVAIDDSELSFYALQWVLNNLFKNSDIGQSSMEMSQQDSDTLTVAHVIPPFHHYVFPAAEPGLFS